VRRDAVLGLNLGGERVERLASVHAPGALGRLKECGGATQDEVSVACEKANTVLSNAA